MLIEKLDWVAHMMRRGKNKAQIYSIDLHPDGSRFATGAGDSKIRIWSTKSFGESSSDEESSAASSSDEDDDEGGGGKKKKHKKDKENNGVVDGGGVGEPEEESQGAGGLNVSDAMAARMPPRAKTTSAAAAAGEEETDPSRLLAILATHNGPVNCVRWSHKGRFLASASDDKFILIWEKSTGPATSVPFGTQAVENVENWSQLLSLTGHSLDVVDVAWVQDDSLLASASLDNRVMVWHVAQALAQGRRGLQPYRILEGHSSQVKGVCWDPVGKYLASMGQDQKLIVWRTSDWAPEAIISEPFAETAKQESLFRRISWSPDGGSVCATNASKNSRHVAAVLTRGGASNSKGWESTIDLVGHERPVVATRFCPLIFRGSKQDDAISTTAAGSYTLVALGDDDSGLLTIWCSVKARPLLVIREAFTSCTTDFSWSSDGLTLLACCQEGDVLLMSFERGELGPGRPMTSGEIGEFFRRTYGVQPAGGLGSGAPILRESALVPLPPTTTTISTTAGGLGAASSSSLLQEDEDSSQMMETNRDPQGSFSSSPLVSSTSRPPLAGAGAATAGSDSTSGVGANWLQARPKDGTKKRIRPQVVSTTTTTGGGTGAAGNNMLSTSPSNRHRGLMEGSRPSLGVGSGGPMSKRARHLEATTSVIITMEEGSKGKGSLEIPCPYAKRPGVLTRIITDFAGFGAGSAEEEGLGGMMLHHEDKEMDMIMEPSSSSGGGAALGLLPPVVIHCSVEESSPGLGPWPMSRLRVSRGGQVLWKEAIPGRVMTMCGNATMVALGCQDGVIHIYGATGLRLVPPIVMGGGGIALLECTRLSSSASTTSAAAADSEVEGVGGEEGDTSVRLLARPEAMYLLAIAKDGEVRVWDIYSMKVIVSTHLRSVYSSLLLQDAVSSSSTSSSSAAAAAAAAGGSTSAGTKKGGHRSPTITRARVLKHGMPRFDLTPAGPHGGVVSMIYEGNLQSWMRVGDSRYALSDHAPLSSFAATGGGGAVTMNVVLRGEEQREARAEVTRAHLESKLSVAILLGQKKDVLYYLKVLVGRLMQEGDTGRLRALCDRLAGRRGSSSTSDGGGADGEEGGLCWWRPEKKELVPGLSKHDALAKSVLPILVGASSAVDGSTSNASTSRGGGGGGSSSKHRPPTTAIQRLAKQFQEIVVVRSAER